jgi:hypothetical protein
VTDDEPCCQQCGKALDAKSVSEDFCRQDCQRAWHAERSKPLSAYHEPWHDWAWWATGSY